MKAGNLNFLEPLGHFRPVTGLLYLYCSNVTLPPSCAVVMKAGNLNFLEPLGHSRPVTGLLYLYCSNVTLALAA